MFTYLLSKVWVHLSRRTPNACMHKQEQDLPGAAHRIWTLGRAAARGGDIGVLCKKRCELGAALRPTREKVH